MSNPRPDALKARQGKRRRNRPGNLEDLQATLWAAIERAETILGEADGHDMQLRAIHAIAQCCGQYARLIEAGEMEVRMSHLEERVQALSLHSGGLYNGHR